MLLQRHSTLLSRPAAQQSRCASRAPLLPLRPGKLAKPLRSASSSSSEQPSSSSSAPPKEEDTKKAEEHTKKTEEPQKKEVESFPIETSKEDYFGSEELVSELKTNFGQKGEVYFFAQAAVFLLIIFCPFQLQGLLDLFSTLMLTTGIVFIAYGLLSLGRNLSPMPQPRQKHSLVTTGMYSYVRHPMYAGLLLASFGLAAVTRNETRLALAFGLWFILEKKVAEEENFLSQRYPEEYAQYRSQVKKFLPFLY